MLNKYRKLFPVIVMGLIAGLHVPEPVEARATVDSRDLVSRQRVGRGEYLYSFTLSINNVGPALNDVKVYVNCEANGATLVDDIVEFGDIAEDAVTTSTDTFSIRVNRRIRFNPDCLTYEIGFDTPLIISGQAIDNELALAEVTAIVVRPASGRPIIDSGRPIIDSYSTFADDQGNYTLEIEAVTQDDFITLTADGVGEQEEALLTSSLGTVGELHDVGESGSIIVNAENFGALNITHITTAQDELVRRLNGGELPSTDGELAALRSQVNGAELLTLASVIKTIVDNPQITLPPGINNTLELIQNPTVFAQTLADLEENFPEELDAATQQTADDLNIGFTPDELDGPLYAVNRDNLPLTGGSYVFDFDPNGNGSVVLIDGDSPTTWLVNSEGEVEVTLLDPPIIESFQFIGQEQVRVQITTERLTLVKLTDGPTVDQVFALARSRTTYPDNPELEDEFSDAVAAPENVFLALGDSGIVPVSAEDLAGGSLATWYLHSDNQRPLAGTYPQLGADVLSFNADGTGTTSRLQLGFAWSIDATGSLQVNFDNGDFNRFIRYSEDGIVAQTIVVGALTLTEESQTFASEAVPPSPNVDFAEQNLVNRRYRSLAAVVDPDFTFEFLYLPDGSGCRISGNGTEFGAQRFDWTSTPEQWMDLSRYLDFEPSVPYSRRSWEAIAVVPGLEGDRYWVIETLEFNQSLDPAYEFEEPLVTTGRLNSYEFVEDLSGTFNPCGFEPEFELTTLFDSNNAGDGNMFNLNTGFADVWIAALDLNVEYGPDTEFEVEIYVTDGPYEDTITALPNCTFNCTFDESQWTLVASGTAFGNGTDQPTFFDFDDFLLPSESTTGIWIRVPQESVEPVDPDPVRYTNGTATAGDPNELEIELGSGTFFNGVSDRIARDRVWNGTIYYDLE